MSFDTVAPHYRWMETILAGRKLHRCRIEFLDRISAPQNILLPGEGHGRSLVECRRRFPEARITCLDASAKMLIQARREMARQGMDENLVDFVHMNSLVWTPPANKFDLIVTNFFLDCFPVHQFAQVIQTLVRSATANANWLISDFQIPGAGIRRLRSQLILWVMYAFFRAVTQLPARRITPPDCYMRNAGFTLQSRVESEWGLLHSDWWRRRNEEVKI